MSENGHGSIRGHCPAARLPRATYRVQLNSGFDFDDAAQIADYLAGLGVSHLYCSPYLQAAPGSTHGYDVVDPSRVNAELGGEEGRERLCAALSARGLGQVIDVVPNHMATSAANAWWWDVLENGLESPHARVFDIDWDPPEPRLAGRVLIPVLGDHLGRVIDAGELKLEGGCVRYHELRFPLRPDLPRGDDLFALLARQHYRLAWWRAGADDLNYRRFFDIDGLIGVRVEDPEVFAATHDRILGWLADGSVQGLRIDHPDGLRRPAEYLARLRAASPGAWVVVEKILEHDEELPAWPVDGTTGYDFCQRVGALFVDASAEAAFSELYERITGECGDYGTVVERARREALGSLLVADVRRVAHRFVAACEEHPSWRDFTRAQLADALTEIAVAFGVYRSYVDAEGATPADVEEVTRSVERVAADRIDLSADLLEFLRAILLAELDGPASRAARMAFQQLTGTVAAKGVEDTAFYRYLRFVALNEVGGAPDVFGASGVEDFHEHCLRMQRHWPGTMLSLSTHDTKRSEDVRARLFALSEWPEHWTRVVEGWMERSGRLREVRDRPDRNTEYLLYQTLVGAHPLPLQRASDYMIKATREAGVHTSWTAPQRDYEKSLLRFIRALFEDERFVAELCDLADRLTPPGRVNSLAQKLVQLTAPGVPDLYQGTELWDLSLVDPDNRRPVDFGLRRRRLDALAGLDAAQIWARADEGLPKLWVIRQALTLRAARPHVFGPEGDYAPLAAQGPAADHAVAFCRGGESISVVPRLVSGLWRAGGFRDTHLMLPAGRWRDVLCGRRYAEGPVLLAELMAQFPVALLAREPE